MPLITHSTTHQPSSHTLFSHTVKPQWFFSLHSEMATILAWCIWFSWRTQGNSSVEMTRTQPDLGGLH